MREIGDLSLVRVRLLFGFAAPQAGRRRLLRHASAASLYNALSRYETDQLSPVFAELADKFVGFVDVLSEVSERTFCASNADLLRLYEKWLKTGSRRSGQLLVERGVVPNASVTMNRRPVSVACRSHLDNSATRSRLLKRTKSLHSDQNRSRIAGV